MSLSRLASQAQSKLAYYLTTPEGQQELRNKASEFGEGLGYLPERIAGAPVDFLSAVARGPMGVVDDLTRPGGPAKVPLGSEWILDRTRGEDRSLGGLGMAGDVLGQVAIPGPGEAVNAMNAATVGRVIAGGLADAEQVAARQIFAGKAAANADLERMARAEARLDAGDDPAKVWAEEGWFRGPDGKMRWEIDDSQSYADLRSLIDESADTGRDLAKEPVPLDFVYGNQGFYDAYPDLANARTAVWPPERLGAARGAVTVSGKVILRGNNTDEQARDILAHELQHVIQGREGFAVGGSPSEMAVTFDRARKDLAYANDLAMLTHEATESYGGDLNAAYRAITDAGIDLDESAVMDAIRLGERGVADRVAAAQSALNSLGPAAQRVSYGDIGDTLYRRLAGEAEARAVQARLNLTPEQRRARYPLEDYDVPVNELIIRGQSNGPQMSQPVNAMADLTYMGPHRPMTVEQGGAPAFDLTGAFGEDIYGPNAIQYFGAGVPGERETLRVLRQIRGNPDAMVTIYRGVPEGVDKINPGDWVSLSPSYAEDYGNVVKMQVPAKSLVGSGDAFFEFGYFPEAK